LPEHSNATGIASDPSSCLSFSATSSSAEFSGDLEARCEAVDRVHASRSGQPRDLSEDEADGTAADEHDRRGEVPLFREGDRVQTDREHLREVGAVVEGERIRQQLRPRIVRGECRELRVPPAPEHPRAGRDIGDAALDDLACRPVAEDDGIVLRRLAGQEESKLRIPPLSQVRVRRAAADVGHLGARADHRGDRAHANHAIAERRERIAMALDGPALDDARGAATELAARGHLIREAHSMPDARSRSRTYTTDAGRTASGSPESAASSKDA